MSTSKSRKKYRIRKGRVAMAAGVLILIIGIIVFFCIRAGIKHHNNKETPQETVDYNAVVPKGQFVHVELDDCNMYIGSELDLKCSSEPEEYAAKVIWTSSDEEVVTVDGKGHIKVVGTGAAAITATYGVLADSVVIRAVTRDDEGISDDLPVYDVKDNKVIVVREAQTDSSDGSDTQPQNPENESKEPDKEPADNSNTATKPAGQGGNTSESRPSQDAVKESEAAKTYAAINEAVKASGFQPYIDNTYIYREDGNYLGEAIVQENMTQIYVMTRTTAMDNAFKQVVQSVIPNSYEDVFARFISATEDQTFGADGMRVRIVAPVNGGHMQLIIYY